ncbi:putative sulfate transport protein CysZ [bacterium BMS3Abin10]|nr:putative sulfate transport protein CysZ [bacterium BMS3Abin10]GBE39348.1 putative sulfate transport protein CysZ [bacterium BMS3Bbin08]
MSSYDIKELMTGDLLSGAGYFFSGLKLITKPGMRRFVLVPVIINTVVFAIAIWISIDQFHNFLDWLLPQANSWLSEFARDALWVFFGAVVLLILFFTFTLVANLLGAPFNGLLAEKTETYLTGIQPQDPGGLGTIMADILPSLLNEVQKLLYFVILGSGVFVISLIPGVNFISPVLWIIFSSWIFSLEYIAYPMENHNIRFRQVRAELRRMRMLSLGFGAAVMIATLIPLVNFMVMPAAVAGASALWVERSKDIIPEGADH